MASATYGERGLIGSHHRRLSLARLVGVAAKLCPRSHRDLARGMVAELDAIDGSAERTRFAAGAIAAIARMALLGSIRAIADAPAELLGLRPRNDDAHNGGPTMPQPTSKELLRRHLTPFLVSFGALTLLLMANQSAMRIDGMRESGASTGAIVEVLFFSMPFTAALTLPMAVFVAVAWVFTRLGSEGVLASARRTPDGTRALVRPVLLAAAVATGVALVSNAELVPRANNQIVAALGLPTTVKSDRTMTFGELLEAARTARATQGGDSMSAVAFEVEVHKKVAISFACLIFALLGAGVGLRFPRGGRTLVSAASFLLFMGYYMALVAGEAFADQQLVSPGIAIWTANVLLLVTAFVLFRGAGRRPLPPNEESLALDALG